jgi:hypothetical protein
MVYAGIMPKGVYPHKHIVPKIYDDDLVDRVATLYYGGEMSQAEIAAELGLTQKVIWKLMRNHHLPTRKRAKRDQRGEKNSWWKGADAKYEALHIRVQVARGTPHVCSVCDCRDNVRYEWANLTGDYNDVNDYARMCVPCHRKFDNNRRSISGERTSPVRRG